VIATAIRPRRTPARAARALLAALLGLLLAHEAPDFGATNGWRY
jgi:hypothetical protein